MNRFAYNRSDRLLRRSEFVDLSNRGEKVHTRFFLAITAPRQQGHHRLGITVTRRVGTAVTRNRIKRICREYFRLNRHRVSGQQDINIIAKKEAADQATGTLFKDLESIFQRISRQH